MAISSRQSGAELTQHGLGIKYPVSSRVLRCPHCSEGALEQAVAPTARGTDLLGAKPLHHVAGVASVSARQAEIGGAPHGHVADGALEGEALADGALGAAHLAAAVAAVHAELCRREHTESETVSAGGIMDKAALNTASCSADQPLKLPKDLPQSSIRMGWHLEIVVCSPYGIKGTGNRSVGALTGPPIPQLSAGNVRWISSFGDTDT